MNCETCGEKLVLGEVGFACPNGHGKIVHVSSAYNTCTNCDGGKTLTCRACAGSGRGICVECGSSIVCRTCRGTGVVACPDCGGSGIQFWT